MNILPGKAWPIGATVTEEGVNFSVFSKHSTSFEILLFDNPNATEPSEVILLDKNNNRTFYYWHALVPGLKAGQVYGFRVGGPFKPEIGLRFEPRKVLLDPYARAIAGMDVYDRDAAKGSEENLSACLKSVVIDPGNYDWEDDRPINRQYKDSLIYEMHVKGFTQNPNSGVSPEKRGTYAGVVEKIPYLKSLGITAVELQPVQQFDPYDAPPGLTNYWGYSPIGFFAPHLGYCTCNDPVTMVNEFRDMVKALHQANIGVILDVVFNHTAEGNEDGPTLCFKGIENKAYYLLEKEMRYYSNYSGCGNTFNANHSVARRLIRDCLKAWVDEYHIDGFRFDLASILSRDESGIPLENPPILWEIESDPVLAGTKIIAETWDAAGLYQVGSFVGDKWAEWNGRYRDDVRSFIKGDPGMVQTLAHRISGSPDIYRSTTRDPNRSINFITCHDGFTLNDLVTYDRKHNDANHENNRDGSNENLSWNCGWEGPSSDPAIENLRLRQIKNFLTIMFLSQGTPMLLMGDEVRRTQHGNNNAYCQDNELGWFDWDQVERNADLLDFVKKVIHFTQHHEAMNQKEFWSNGPSTGRFGITWHGVNSFQPDLSHNSHTLAYTLHNAHDEGQLHVMVNAFWEDLVFALPRPAKGFAWRRIIDTNLPHPKDFVEVGDAPPWKEKSYAVSSRSVVVMIEEREN